MTIITLINDLEMGYNTTATWGQIESVQEFRENKSGITGVSFYLLDECRSIKCTFWPSDYERLKTLIIPHQTVTISFFKLSYTDKGDSIDVSNRSNHKYQINGSQKTTIEHTTHKPIRNVYQYRVGNRRKLPGKVILEPRQQLALVDATAPNLFFDGYSMVEVQYPCTLFHTYCNVCR